MTGIKFYYFPFSGRGDPIRLALDIAGIEYEDVRLPFPEFMKQQDKFPLQQLPVLEVNGQFIDQSLAILRYAGRAGKTSLYPADPFEAAKVDQMVYAADELFRSQWAGSHSVGEAKRKERQVVNEETFPWLAKFFEAQLTANAAAHPASPYLVGSTITTADLFVALIFEFVFRSGFWDHLRADVFTPYPRFSALIEAVRRHPAVVARYAKFPPVWARRLYYTDATEYATRTLRTIFALSGVPYEERHAATHKGLSHVPALELNTNFAGEGTFLHALTAQRSHVARLANLYPEDEKASAIAEEIVSLVDAAVSAIHGGKGAEEAVGAVEAALQKTSGSETTTVADVAVFALEGELSKKSLAVPPKVREVAQKIKAVPGVQALGK